MNRMIWAVVVLGLVAPIALGDDMVDNPAYKSWASCKVGATVKMESVSVMAMGDKTTTVKSTATYTLKDLTAEKAVVEMATEMDMSGTKMAGPSNNIEILAKVKSSATQPASMPGMKMTKKGEGDEEITVGGKKYKAHWIEYQMSGDQAEGTSKTWTCPDVPGTMLKMVSESTKPMNAKTTMEVTEIKTGA
jgi:hypothetical protein